MADQRLQISCLRKTIGSFKIFSGTCPGVEPVYFTSTWKCNSNGIQLKHAKAQVAKVYQDNYPEAFSSVVDLSPQSSVAYVVDGMFTIHTPPWDLHRTFKDYTLHRVWVFSPWHSSMPERAWHFSQRCGKGQGRRNSSFQ